MSSIRLSGSTSGHYDLTVPAVAGTNSIDLSKLIVDNDDRLTLTSNATFTGLQIQSSQFTDFDLKDSTNNRSWIMSNRGASSGLFEILQRDSSNNYTTPFRINGSGYVTLPRLPVCYGRLSGTGAQTSGFLSPLSVDYDPLSMVSTANKRITVPVAGRYCILAAQLVDPVPTYTYLNLRVNQTTVFHDHNNMMAGGDNMTHKVSVVRNLSANDYIDFTYSGDITTLWAGNHSYYSVHLIG